MIRGIRFAGILLAGAVVMATDYVRLAPIDSEGLRQWRDELVSLFNSRDIQVVEVGCLTAYILGFAIWRHYHLSCSDEATTKHTKDTKRQGWGAGDSDQLSELNELHGGRDHGRNGGVKVDEAEVVHRGIRGILGSKGWGKGLFRVFGLFRGLIELAVAGPRERHYEMLRTACLLAFCGAAVARFFASGSNPSGCTDAPVLLLGVVVGQVLRFVCLSRRNANEVLELTEDILTAFVILFTMAVFFQPDWWHGFQYHGQRRWQGIWWNPNTFGLLMALGVVGALGMMKEEGRRKNAERDGEQGTSNIQHRTSNVEHRTLKWGVWARRGLWLAAAGVMGVGLVKSYSRGAWLGAGLALGYLGCQVIRLPGCRESRLAGFLRREWAAVGVLAVSVVVLGLWMRRDTENLAARRVLSVANVNDFSWRNRLVAYEGGLQMMAARPWLGFGWGQPKEVYEALYMPASLDDGRAIDLNDYFRVGMTLGLPALACFVAYLFLSLAGGTERWLGTTCRAGLIVLLIGFWLQQGLFWLSLTVPFWVLLELASSSQAHSRTPGER